MPDSSHLERELENQDRALSLLCRTLASVGAELVHIDSAALESFDQLCATATRATIVVHGGVRA
jgi:hypothetical protein